MARDATDTHAKQAVTSYLHTLDTDFYHTRKQALVPWWVKYLNVIGDYMEV